MFYLWVVLCVPGSQGNRLQIQFTAQIYSRNYVSDHKQKEKQINQLKI